MPQIDQVILKYRQLRDKKKEIEEAHKLQLDPINKSLEKLESWLQQQLLSSGVDSMATENGTAYISRTASVAIKDWSETIEFIINNQLWHVLEKRLAKTQIEEFVKDNNTNFPGTEINYVIKTNVRK